MRSMRLDERFQTWLSGANSSSSVRTPVARIAGAVALTTMARVPATTVERRLRTAYGRPWHGNKRDPLGETIYIILSAQTREAEYQRAFATLWQRYRSWEAVRRASRTDVADLIRFAGLADRKAGQIQDLLERVRSDRGTTSLRFLRDLEDDAALAYLEGLPGIGSKSARCILMYALGRDVLPVDAHVWRISQRLGWIGGGRHPDQRRSGELEATVPPRLRCSLHVTMVAHGRAVCRARPSCGICCLRDVCPSAA